MCCCVLLLAIYQKGKAEDFYSSAPEFSRALFVAGYDLLMNFLYSLGNIPIVLEKLFVKLIACLYPTI